MEGLRKSSRWQTSRSAQNGDIIPCDEFGRTSLADSVSITFRKQKNGTNGVTITQHRNDRPGEEDICPVRALAELVHRINGYGSKTRTRRKDLGIDAFTKDDADEPTRISSKTILERLRLATTIVGERRLGIKADKIGTHSIRSGAAMAMYLAGVPCETIQLIGRWRSRTFMRYLRIQVPDTTLGVASRMTSRHTFYTIEPDGRNPENGGNQVDTQQRDAPPNDTHERSFARISGRERQNY